MASPFEPFARAKLQGQMTPAEIDELQEASNHLYGCCCELCTKFGLVPGEALDPNTGES